MKQNITLSIVLPCYNEVLSFPSIFERLNQLLNLNHHVEVVLVDNGSSDQTPQVLEELIGKSLFKNRIKSVRTEKNLGYGGGILYGLAVADGNILAWSHADSQTDVFDVIKGEKFFKNHFPKNMVVKGFRIKRGFFHKLFSVGMSFYIACQIKKRFNDINAQPKIFTRSFYKEHLKDKAPNDFSLDLYLLIKAHDHGTIVEFPVRFLKREFGDAKGGGSFSGKINLIKRTLQYVKQLKENLKESSHEER